MPTKPIKPIIIKTTQLTNQELNKLVGQLKKLRLSTVELAKIAVLIPFLDRIRQDPNQYI